MKTEERLETAAVFLERVTVAVSELKHRLQQEYQRTYPGLGEIIGVILDEEEANAWQMSIFPHLLLPDLVEAHIVTLGLEPADTKKEDIRVPLIEAPHVVAAVC